MRINKLLKLLLLCIGKTYNYLKIDFIVKHENATALHNLCDVTCKSIMLIFKTNARNNKFFIVIKIMWIALF